MGFRVRVVAFRFGLLRTLSTVTALDKKPLSFGEGTLGFLITKPAQFPEL